MKINSPIIRILRLIKTDDAKGNSLLDTVIKYLNDVEKMSVSEISIILEISVSNVYKALKRRY